MKSNARDGQQSHQDKQKQSGNKWKEDGGFELQLTRVKVETGVEARAAAPGSHTPTLKAHKEHSKKNTAKNT